MAIFSGCTRSAPKQPELRLFTWSEYFMPGELEAFEKASGIKIKVDYYSSNEEMLTKIQLTADGAGYDIILPSDYMVRTMRDLHLLTKLDHNKLPFLKDFPETEVHPPYDPGLVYSIPLAVGMTGLAWNEKLFPNLPKNLGWKDFFENPELKGRVTLLDDTKEALQVVLLMNGKDLSTANKDDVEKAFAYLTAHKDQLKGFTSETRTAIESDECALCMAYSGDVISVSNNKPEIKFIRPVDGITTWADNFAIPANAQNPDAAYKFISAVLSPEGASAFTARTHYRTFQEQSKGLLPPEIRSNKTIYPDAKSSDFHYLVDRRDIADFIDRNWALLKSH